MGCHEYGYFAKDFPLNMEVLQKTAHCGGEHSMHKIMDFSWQDLSEVTKMETGPTD